MSNSEWPNVGDFISIPAWNDWGCVVGVKESEMRAGAVDVVVQHHPDSESTTLYRLAPGEFVID